MTYPAVIFLGLLALSLFLPREKAVYLVFGSAAFGALAVVPPEAIGGINLLPQAAAGLMLIVRYMLDPKLLKPLGTTAFQMKGLGLLTLFMIVALISAAFYPRLFAGQTYAFSMRSAAPEPVGPSMGNITQTSYLLSSYLVALVFQFAGGSRRFLAAFFGSVMVGGALLAASGYLDLVLGGASTAVTAPFKTALYTYMEGSEVLGFRRIDGFMTEASQYGSECVFIGALMAFLAPAFETARARFAAHALTIALIGAALISTSSTAIVGVAVLVVLYVGDIVRRSSPRAAPGRDLWRWEVILCSAAVFLVAAIGALAPDVFATPMEFLDTLVFKKTQSGSYTDRMYWTTTAIQALIDTGGIGVGVGSARASNWVVSIFSNTGVIGGLLLFGFMTMLMLKTAPNRDRRTTQILFACKAAMLVYTLMAALSATTPDFGPEMAALFGIIVAQSRRGPSRQRRRRSRDAQRLTRLRRRGGESGQDDPQAADPSHGAEGVAAQARMKPA